MQVVQGFCQMGHNIVLKHSSGYYSKYKNGVLCGSSILCQKLVDLFYLNSHKNPNISVSHIYRFNGTEIILFELCC